MRPYLTALSAVLLTSSIISGCASTSEVTALTQQLTIDSAGSWLIYAPIIEPEQQVIVEKECVAAWQQAGLHGRAWHASLPQSAKEPSTMLAEAKAAGFTQLIVIDNSSTQLQAPQFAYSAPTISATRNEQGTRVQHYGELSDQAHPKQQAVVDIYPLNNNNKASRLLVNSHEANNLKRISRSQCKALANFITRQ